MVEITVSETPGTSRNVSFEREETEVEARIVAKVLEFSPEGITRQQVLNAIRSRPVAIDNTDFHNSIVNELFLEKDNPAESGKKSTATEPMDCTDLVAIEPSSSSHVIKSPTLSVKDDADYHRAIQESLTTANISQSSRSPIPQPNLEAMIRNPNLSTGLHNSGNTCWFNCLAQLLFSLPRFRLFIYYAAPTSWADKQVINVHPKNMAHTELLLLFRHLFAELQFSEKKYIEVGRALQVVHNLHCRINKSAGALGTQQDATELLLQTFEWLENGAKAAFEAQLNPDQTFEPQIEENLVIADSTTTAPNSDIAGTAPPGYNLASEDPATSSLYREPQSRPNSPTIKAMPPPSLFGTRQPKEELSSIDEAMDITEIMSPRPLPSKHPRIPPAAATPVTEELIQVIEELKTDFKRMFESICHSEDVTEGSEEDIVSNSREVRNCPQFFQIHVNYGNLHDALEATTFDTGRGSLSYTRNFFDKLPAVIFMGLSRFGYKDNIPNKLHDKFTFPRTIYMDRYLRSNLEVVLELRKKQLTMRQQLAELRAQLNGLRRYPHGNGGETHLRDAVETVLQAVSNAKSREAPASPSPIFGPFLPTATVSTESDSKFIPDLGKMFPAFTSDQFPGLENCLETLASISKRLDAAESETMLQEKLLEDSLKEVYEKDGLFQHEYELHGIIVHSGEASRGHYWTYKLKKSIDGTEEWEKLNDQNIEVVPWSKVETDAFGTGSKDSPSAYLLMYVRSNSDWLMSNDRLTQKEAMDQLPTDLREFVVVKRDEFHESLRLFREEKARESLEAVTRPQEDAGSFSWYRSRSEEIDDENANPTGDEYTLHHRLTVYSGPIFNDLEYRLMGQMIQKMWAAIVTIGPERFEGSEHVLDSHLQTILPGPTGAIAFMEHHLSYPILELRNDAENDVERVYNAYLTEYLPNFALKNCNYRSSFLVFLYSQLPRVHVLIFRYMLVRSLVYSNVDVLVKRAEQELQDFIALDSDSAQFVERISSFLAHVFELGALTAWGCRTALENFQMANDKKTDAERAEVTYIAMLSARNSRVTYRLIEEVAGFMEQPSVFFVNEPCLELCTLLPILVQMKCFIQHLASESLAIIGMEFFMSINERRITLREIIPEMIAALNNLKTWTAKSDAGTLPDRMFNLKQSLDALVSNMEMIMPCVECTEEKLQPASIIAAAMDTPLQGQEKATDALDCDILDAQGEMRELEKYHKDLGNIQEKINEVTTSIAYIVSQAFK